MVAAALAQTMAPLGAARVAAVVAVMVASVADA